MRAILIACFFCSAGVYPCASPISSTNEADIGGELLANSSLREESLLSYQHEHEHEGNNNHHRSKVYNMHEDRSRSKAWGFTSIPHGWGAVAIGNKVFILFSFLVSLGYLIWGFIKDDYTSFQWEIVAFGMPATSSSSRDYSVEKDRESSVCSKKVGVEVRTKDEMFEWCGNSKRLLCINNEVRQTNQGYDLFSGSICALSLDGGGDNYKNYNDSEVFSCAWRYFFNFWLPIHASSVLLMVLRFVIYCWILIAWINLALSSRYMKPDELPPFPLYMFFTFWNYLLLSLYFFTAFSYSAFYHYFKFHHDFGYHTGITHLHSPLIVIAEERVFFSLYTKRWVWFRKLLWLLYQQQLTSNLIVTTVFWSLTYPYLSQNLQARMLEFPALTQHIFNLAFILIEVFVNKIPVLPQHTAFTLVVSLSYLLLSVTNYGILPSIPLDFRSNRTAIVLMVLLGLHILSHEVFCRVSRYKQSREK